MKRTREVHTERAIERDIWEVLFRVSVCVLFAKRTLAIALESFEPANPVPMGAARHNINLCQLSEWRNLYRNRILSAVKAMKRGMRQRGSSEASQHGPRYGAIECDGAVVQACLAGKTGRRTGNVWNNMPEICP